MADTPPLSDERRKVTSSTRIMKVTEDEPEVTVLHLLMGSTFKLGICSR